MARESGPAGWEGGGQASQGRPLGPCAPALAQHRDEGLEGRLGHGHELEPRRQLAHLRQQQADSGQARCAGWRK